MIMLAGTVSSICNERNSFDTLQPLFSCAKDGGDRAAKEIWDGLGFRRSVTSRAMHIQ